MKKAIIILALLLACLVNIYAENPYKQFGSEGVELLTEQERSGEYKFEIKSTPSDSTSNFLYFNVKEGTVSVLSINNDTVKITDFDRIPNKIEEGD